MTQHEYTNSGCENRHALFTFSNGNEVSGVITTFFFNEPDNYYLVRTPDMIEFKKYMDENNYAKMKTLCTLVNLNDIADVEQMQQVTFTIRANVAFQRLNRQTQDKALSILQRVLDESSFLNNQQTVNLQEKPYYVIRLDNEIRLLIQRKKYGVIVNDIIFRK
jgi:hypothetical protein